MRTGTRGPLEAQGDGGLGGLSLRSRSLDTAPWQRTGQRGQAKNGPHLQPRSPGHLSCTPAPGGTRYPVFTTAESSMGSPRFTLTRACVMMREPRQVSKP